MQTTPPAPKLLSPDRSQGVLLMSTYVEDLVEQSHPVRIVWAHVCKLDLSAFFASIKSQEGGDGRPAIDPRLLLALWMFAVVDGVDSGRKLARLCRESMPYRWLCGGVQVEYHTLNDFRAKNADKFGKLLTSSVTALISEGLVHLDTIALDGVRVRASAGGGSFRRPETLRRLKSKVDEHIKELTAAWDRDGVDPKGPRPKRKIRELNDKSTRLESAARIAEELQAARKAELPKAKGKRKAQLEKSLARGSRASSTDLEARVVHMPDNGFRPGFVGHAAVEGKNGFIVGAYVTNQGADNAQIPVMLDQLERSFGRNQVKKVLADSGFRQLKDMRGLEKRGVAVYTPVPTAKVGTDRFAHRKSDNLAVKRWRDRMRSEEGSKTYKRRGQLVEISFAGMRNRGLYRFRVRGKTKCEGVFVLHSLAHNMLLAEVVRARLDQAA